VAARHTDRPTRGNDVRPRDLVLADRIAHIDCEVLGAAEIPNGRHAGEERFARVLRAHERALRRRREHEDARRLRFAAHFEMHVRVYETRYDARRFEGTSARGHGQRGVADARYATVFHEQRAVALRFAHIIVKRSEADRERWRYGRCDANSPI